MERQFSQELILEHFKAIIEDIDRAKMTLKKAQLEFLNAGYGYAPKRGVVSTIPADTLDVILGWMHRDLDDCMLSFLNGVNNADKRLEPDLKSGLLALIDRNVFYWDEDETE